MYVFGFYLKVCISNLSNNSEKQRHCEEQLGNLRKRDEAIFLKVLCCFQTDCFAPY